MKVFIQTDMECVAGMVNSPDYCLPPESNERGDLIQGKYYERGKELATMEVNAAVEGLLEGGATEILVLDSHGPGALDVSRIHPGARILAGRPFPDFAGLDGSFDAAIMIGQHAKADTNGGHLAHSGNFARADWILNGRSFGEIGWFLIAASYYDVPVVMISGDVAGCEEARELLPSIETVAVIEGVKLGTTEGMTQEQAQGHNVAAIHIPPLRARQMIKEAACKCLKTIDSVEHYWVEPPYEMICITRQTEASPRMKDVRTSDDYMKLVHDAETNYVPIE